MAKNKDIGPLIKLLDDPDPEIFRMIENQLLSMGPEVVPELEKAWDGALNELVQNRLEEVIHTVQLN